MSELQRRALTGLSVAARSELTTAVGRLAGLPAEDVRDALMELLPAVGDTYGDGAAALGAEWFDTLRLEAGVSGRFQASPTPRIERARWEAMARWGVDPLYGDEPDLARVLALLDGGMQRSITDRHRATVTENAVRDPRASGWQRMVRADACSFCLMLHGRGGVYTEASVEFKSHDHCSCYAAPSWDSNVRKVIGVPFRYSQRKADWSAERKRRENQAVYDYIAEHDAN